LHQAVLKIHGDLLNDGEYTVDLHFVKDTSTVIYKHINLLSFKVEDANREGNWYGKWVGAVRPAFDFKFYEG
jgi:lipopolysaccharide transport system ATP-binding protein